MKQFIRKIKLNIPADELYQYHFRKGAFQRQAQPWLDMKLLEQSGNITDGRMKISIGKGFFKQLWEADHQADLPGLQFKYIQVKGPFNFWEHTHSVEADGSNGAILTDAITYRKPWYILTSTVQRELERLFDYRHSLTQNDMKIRGNYLKSGGKSLNILIAGASGLVGTDLIPFLTTQNHSVKTLVRDKKDVNENSVYWNPDHQEVNPEHLEGYDAIIDLAGDNIGNGRWTDEKKKSILESRVKATSTLAKAIKKLKKPPKVFLNASAIGYYGDRGDEWVDENSPHGSGFLSEVCQQWEAEAKEAERPETRVVLLRTGVVFSPKGGAFATMLTPFKLGLGGVIGSGKQWVSWVAIDDLIAMIHHILATPEIRGPVNAVSSNPVTNYEMTKTIGKVIGRLTLFPLPAFMAKLVFGREKAEEMLLASTRVKPGVLEKTGYQFLFPQLEDALRHMLGQTKGRRE
jgi:uncharacterized protein (TIGR01777 family)